VAHAAFVLVGALLGPAPAAWILAIDSWPTVMLLLGTVAVPLTAGFLIVYPHARVGSGRGEAGVTEAGRPSPPSAAAVGRAAPRGAARRL
jgi:hypothetical protein